MRGYHGTGGTGRTGAGRSGHRRDVCSRCEPAWRGRAVRSPPKHRFRRHSVLMPCRFPPRRAKVKHARTVRWSGFTMSRNCHCEARSRRSNLLPDEPSYGRQAGDCFGAARLAMTGCSHFILISNLPLLLCAVRRSRWSPGFSEPLGCLAIGVMHRLSPRASSDCGRECYRCRAGQAIFPQLVEASKDSTRISLRRSLSHGLHGVLNYTTSNVYGTALIYCSPANATALRHAGLDRSLPRSTSATRLANSTRGPKARDAARCICVHLRFRLLALLERHDGS